MDESASVKGLAMTQFRCPGHAVGITSSVQGTRSSVGYSFGPHRYKANGAWYLSASPSKKSLRRLKANVAKLLVPGNTDPWSELRNKLNKSLLGCPIS
jgi:hypothetical protein